jgi:hypothetical protein
MDARAHDLRGRLTLEPTWEHDIKPMFRESDREEMMYLFDLWSYKDVRDNADAIYDRVSDGTMPCDEPWPQEQIDLFGAWVEAGSPR